MTKKEWINSQRSATVHPGRGLIHKLAKKLFDGDKSPLNSDQAEALYLSVGMSFSGYSDHNKTSRKRVPKLGIKEIYHFTRTTYDRARMALSIAVMVDGTVQEAYHKKGECPFLDYLEE